MRLAIIAMAVSLCALPARAETLLSLRSLIDSRITSEYPALDLLYQDLHAHPELGFEEKRTASLLAAKMRAAGFEVTEGVGGTGVVAIFHNGPGRAIMVRTELDALPMEEKTGLPYASRAQAIYDGKPTFVAHSCGHDNHMAWWVGTAETLVALKSHWHGTLMFVAQPAEEIVGGAAAMVKDGLFTRFPKPDFGLAAHVHNDPTGTIRVKAGVYNSNSNAVEITFKGRGAHGSRPSDSIDPIVEAAHFVTDVQTVVSRQKEAGTFGVITVGSFHAGTAGNIIPDQATLQLTLRSFTPEVKDLLLNGVKRTANAAAEMAIAPPPDIRVTGSANAVVNDPVLARQVADALQQAAVPDVIFTPESAPGISSSEDYSVFIEAGVPSVYLGIGGYDPETIAAFKAKGQPVPTNHSPFFAPDHDRVIPVGIRTLSLSALALLGTGHAHSVGQP
jgi:hippurate hydrolase